MNCKKLVIHAGFHKTGTTLLQLSMLSAAERLLDAGIYFPTMGFKKNVGIKGVSASGHDGLVDALINNDQSILAGFRSELNAHLNDKKQLICFLSSENLSHPFSPGKISRLLSSAAFKQLFSDWDIYILLGYKASDKLIYSHYVEMLVNRMDQWMPTPQDFLKLKIGFMQSLLNSLNKMQQKGNLQYKLFDSSNIFEGVCSVEGIFDDGQKRSLISLPIDDMNKYQSVGSEFAFEQLTQKFDVAMGFENKDFAQSGLIKYTKLLERLAHTEVPFQYSEDYLKFFSSVVRSKGLLERMYYMIYFFKVKMKFLLHK